MQTWWDNEHVRWPCGNLWGIFIFVLFRPVPRWYWFCRVVNVGGRRSGWWNLDFMFVLFRPVSHRTYVAG